MTILGLVLCFLPSFSFSLLQVPSSIIYLFIVFLHNSYSFRSIKYPTMTGMQPIPSEVSEWRLKVANVVHDVFASFFSPDRSSRTSENGESSDETTTPASRGLETSRWAPQNASANVSKTGASRSNTRVTKGRSLEDSRWAPKDVVQCNRPAARGLEGSGWASKSQKGTEVKVSFYFIFYRL